MAERLRQSGCDITKRFIVRRDGILPEDLIPTVSAFMEITGYSMMDQKAEEEIFRILDAKYHRLEQAADKADALAEQPGVRVEVARLYRIYCAGKRVQAESPIELAGQLDILRTARDRLDYRMLVWEKKCGGEDIQEYDDERWIGHYAELKAEDFDSDT